MYKKEKQKTMKLNKTSIEKLKKILEKDYKASLSEDDVISLGCTLLTLTHRSLVRAETKNSSPVKERCSFEPNTST
jgi:hypothetical protein